MILRANPVIHALTVDHVSKSRSDLPGPLNDLNRIMCAEQSRWPRINDLKLTANLFGLAFYEVGHAVAPPSSRSRATLCE